MPHLKAPAPRYPTVDGENVPERMTMEWVIRRTIRARVCVLCLHCERVLFRGLDFFVELVVWFRRLDSFFKDLQLFFINIIFLPVFFSLFISIIIRSLSFLCSLGGGAIRKALRRGLKDILHILEPVHILWRWVSLFRNLLDGLGFVFVGRNLIRFSHFCLGFYQHRYYVVLRRIPQNNILIMDNDNNNGVNKSTACMKIVIIYGW